MSFRKALQYVIHQNRFEIHKQKLASEAENSESDDEAENDQASIKSAFEVENKPAGCV